MRQVIFERFGPPAEVARLTEAPDPVPGPGEVLLRLTLMPINPADLLAMEGRYGAEPPALPMTPGAEAAGVVAALGEGVTRVGVGDAVLPLGSGCWTDRMVVSERALLPMPEGVDPEQAAMLKANPATADLMLSAVDLLPGDWVIQNAANSAVGRLVALFARERGLRTVNLVRRAEAAEALRGTGADAVLIAPDPGAATPDEVLAATGGARPRLGLDAVGGGATGALAATLARGGTVLSYGLLSGAPCRVRAEDLVFRGITLRGFWLAEWFAAASGREVRPLYARLAEGLRAGLFHTPVEARYPLGEIAAALRHAAREGRSGKILLTAEG